MLVRVSASECRESWHANDLPTQTVEAARLRVRVPRVLLYLSDKTNDPDD